VLLLLVAASLVMHAFANPFLGGGGMGGGCGGPAQDPEEVDAEPHVPRPVMFVISGAPRAGKTFLATRLHTLFEAHSHWNISTHYITMDDMFYETFAREHSLDAHKLKTDAFYRWDYNTDLTKFTEGLKASKGPNDAWKQSALEYVANSISNHVANAPKTRHIFILDGFNDPKSMEYVQSLVKNTEFTKSFPEERLEAVYVHVRAPESVREERGLKPNKPAIKAAESDANAVAASVQWTHQFDNDEQGADGIVKMDNFLASVLLREAANQ